MTETLPSTAALCWFELATTDIPRAMRLYRRILGFEAKDMGLFTEAGLFLDYRALKVGEVLVGGMYLLVNEQRAAGVEPHWLPYFAVESLGPVLRRAQELGAELTVSGVQLKDWGRMALITDPFGARLALWEPLAMRLSLPAGETPGLPARCDLLAPDPAAAAEFYTQLFEVAVRRLDLGGHSVALLELPGSTPAAIADPGLLGLENKTRWLASFQVEDCQAASDLAVALKGTLRCAPREIPGLGRLAVVADAQGAEFGLLSR